MKLDRRAWPLFFLAAIAFYFYGLGALPFIGPDEPRYAQVAREMWLRADMVTPTLGGHTWFEKPALLYWMIAAAFSAFGVSEWAARLGPACAGLLSVLAVYWLGRRVERAHVVESNDETGNKDQARELGCWSALALASSAGLMVFSRAVSFDVIVTWTTTVALACFFVAELEHDEKRRRWLLVAFYSAVGASLLAKGLIGIVIPGGVITAYFLLQRRWPARALFASLLWGVPLALAVAAIWYGPVINRNGWKFVDEFFIQHHFARYVSNKYRHPGPIYYYIPTLLALALPWTFVLLSALFNVKEWRWRGLRGLDALSRFRLFALVWLVVPVAFFSVSGSKLPGYILPALPAAALLVGERLSRVARGEGSALVIRLTGLLMLTLAAGGLVYVRRTGYTSAVCSALMLAPLFIAGAFALVAGNLRRAALWLTAGAMLLSIALALNCLGAAVGLRQSTRALLERASARGLGRAPVCGLYVMERTSEFYAAERVMRDANGEVLRFEGAAPVLEAARRHGGPLLVFVPLDGLQQLTDFAALDTEIIGDNGTVALVIANPKG